MLPSFHASLCFFATEFVSESSCCSLYSVLEVLGGVEFGSVLSVALQLPLCVAGFFMQVLTQPWLSFLFNT